MRHPIQRPLVPVPVAPEAFQQGANTHHDELTALRSDLEEEDLELPIGKTDPAEFDDASN